MPILIDLLKLSILKSVHQNKLLSETVSVPGPERFKRKGG